MIAGRLRRAGSRNEARNDAAGWRGPIPTATPGSIREADGINWFDIRFDSLP